MFKTETPIRDVNGFRGDARRTFTGSYVDSLMRALDDVGEAAIKIEAQERKRLAGGAQR